jgi:hypothetical protein
MIHLDIISGEFEIINNCDPKMENIGYLSTDKAKFLKEKYSDQLFNDYRDYLSKSLLQDELKTFTFDQIENKMYMVTNNGKVLEFQW